MSETDHYALSILGPGGSISDDGWKFADADRRRLDYLLWIAAEGHVHTGDVASAGSAPDVAASLVVETDGGSLAPSTSYSYVWTLLDPAGQESGPSPIATAVTAPPVDTPDAPTLSQSTTGGTLNPGNYLYVLSAYTEFSTLETVAGAGAFIQVPATTATNVVTLTLPPLPAGATGFNVYRQGPGCPNLSWVATVDMQLATPPSELVDDGSLDEDCTRLAPSVDTSSAANSVLVSLVDELDAPYVLAAGWSWRLYRSIDPNDFSNSLVATVVADAITYLDVGDATTTTSPPGEGLVLGSPSKIDLTDGAEIQGRLPMSQMSAFPELIEWSFPGPVTLMEATTPWVCEHPQFTIIGARAVLGKNSAPADFDVIIDVLKGSGLNPTYTTIFAAPGDRPRVLVGHQMGARVAPTRVIELVEGDSLVFSVTQQGGANPETQTDRDLTVKVYGYAYGWTESESHPWASVAPSATVAAAARNATAVIS